MLRRTLRRTLLCVAPLAFASALIAQEVVTLSAPVFTSTGAVTFRVWQLVLKRADADQPTSDAEIRAVFRETTDSTGTAFVVNGRTLTCSYSGDAAETLIKALNTANLSTTSLEKRVTTKCQADGKLGAGTISGTAGL